MTGRTQPNSNNSILTAAADEASLSFFDFGNLYGHDYDYEDFFEGSAVDDYDNDSYEDDGRNVLFDHDHDPSFERKFNQSTSVEEESTDGSGSRTDSSSESEPPRLPRNPSAYRRNPVLQRFRTKDGQASTSVLHERIVIQDPNGTYEQRGWNNPSVKTRDKIQVHTTRTTSYQPRPLARQATPQTRVKQQEPPASSASACLYPGSPLETSRTGSSKQTQQFEDKCCGLVDFQDRNRRPRRGKPDAPGEEASTTSSQASEQQQLLCIHICPHKDCNASNCRPLDLTRAATVDLQKTLRNPAFFYVPVALVLKREKEMQLAAQQGNISQSRWNGSLLYRKWQELDAKERRQKQQEPPRRRRRKGNRDPKIITLHPVQALARAHVVSEKFPWWSSWLTVCIRAYYNTGTLRIPRHCHGLEILLALEYFGILYDSPDQLVFDAPAVYLKVKQWSGYFSLRSLMAQWMVEELKQQSRSSSNEHFIFCTHPEILKEGWTLSLAGDTKQQTPIILMEGGLHGPYTAASAKVVNDFFVPSSQEYDVDIDDPIYSSPAVIPGMMREDFLSYLKNVLPDSSIAFTLQQVQLVSNNGTSTRGRKKKIQVKEILRRAVLVITRSPAAGHKDDPISRVLDPPATDIVPDYDHSSVISDASASCADSGAPTDELAFGKLLNSTHKAVSRILKHSTQEKVSGREKNEGFYFRNEQTKASPTKLNNTLDTSGSSSDSSPVAQPKGNKKKLKKPPMIAKKKHSLPRSPLYKVEIQEDGEDAPGFGVEEEKTCEPSPGKSIFDQVPSAANADHIYEDLYHESMFPNSTSLKKSPTMMSENSQLWTPSLLEEPGLGTKPGAANQQQDAYAPVSFVNASPQDHLSVASSITRQPESIIGDNWKVNKATFDREQSEKLNDSGIKDTKESKSKRRKSKKDRQFQKISCAAVENLFGSDACAEDASSARKLHDESFEARFDALLHKNGKGKHSGEHKKKKLNAKERLRAAIEDLKFGAYIESDLDEIRRAATTNDDSQPCQFLSDIYELFAPQPSKMVPGTDRRKSTSSVSTTDSSSRSSAAKASRKNYPHVEIAEAIGISEENVNTAAIVLQVLANGSAVASTEHAEKENRRKPSKTSSRKALVVPKPRQTDEEEAAAKNGIEVYHIPVAAPSSTTASDSAGEPKIPSGGRPPVSRRRPTRGSVRTKPPLAVRPIPNPSKERPTRGKAKPTTQKGKPEKKGKRLFGFMRSKAHK